MRFEDTNEKLLSSMESMQDMEDSQGEAKKGLQLELEELEAKYF